MTARLTLTLPVDLGSKVIEVNVRRFSIGRTPDNDLVIEDQSLSRRHALIEHFEGSFNLSDCGSANGTLVNGEPISGLVELSDWDVLTFGRVDDILVRIYDDAIAVGVPSPQQSRSVASSNRASPVVARSFQLSPPVIAIVAAIVIVLIAGVALWLGWRKNSPNGSKPISTTRRQAGSDSATNDTGVNDSNRTSDGDSQGVDNSPVDESSELTAIEGYASKVLSGISRDPHPVLTEKPLAEINAQVQRSKNSSSVAEELRTMKRVLPQVLAEAKRNGIKPALAVYVTLAQFDKSGGRGDPAQVAVSNCPALAKMRAIFGDELANDSLLSVAALLEGAALQGKITRLAGRVNDSPSTIRSIWYLHDHQVISDETHNFVIRFIALGVIAQNPQKFGINAEPLAF
jgi:FHA domain